MMNFGKPGCSSPHKMKEKARLQMNKIVKKKTPLTIAKKKP